MTERRSTKLFALTRSRSLANNGTARIEEVGTDLDANQISKDAIFLEQRADLRALYEQIYVQLDLYRNVILRTTFSYVALVAAFIGWYIVVESILPMMHFFAFLALTLIANTAIQITTAFGGQIKEKAGVIKNIELVFGAHEDDFFKKGIRIMPKSWLGFGDTYLEPLTGLSKRVVIIFWLFSILAITIKSGLVLYLIGLVDVLRGL